MSKNAVPNPYEGQKLTPEQVLSKMRQLVAEETRNHVLMGLLYNYLQDSKLLEDSDVSNPLDFICNNIQEVSRSSLQLYSAVARDFTQEVCARFGVYRLRYLLTYKDAAKIELNYDEPGSTFILVPDRKGEVKPKLFADCTVEDLRQALERLRKSTSGTPITAEQRKCVDEYREAVVRRFPRGSPVRVQLRLHKGKVVVDFRTIPVEEVSKLSEALLDQLYPVREAPVQEQEQAPQVS